MDSSAAGNHNKVKVMATQLLAKFEENAPQPTGLKRQVCRKPCGSCRGLQLGGGGREKLSTKGKIKQQGIDVQTWT